MTRQHKKHIKINSPKRSLRKDYKKNIIPTIQKQKKSQQPNKKT